MKNILWPLFYFVITVLLIQTSRAQTKQPTQIPYNISYKFDQAGDANWQIKGKNYKSEVKDGVLKVEIRQGTLFIYNKNLVDQEGLPENYHRLRAAEDITFTEAEGEAFAGFIISGKGRAPHSYTILLSSKGNFKIQARRILATGSVASFKAGALNHIEVKIDGMNIKLEVNGVTAYEGAALYPFGTVSWPVVYFENPQKTQVDNFEIELRPLFNSQSAKNAMVKADNGITYYVNEKEMYEFGYSIGGNDIGSLLENASRSVLEVFPGPSMGEVVVEALTVTSQNPDSLFALSERSLLEAFDESSVSPDHIMQKSITLENGMIQYIRTYKINKYDGFHGIVVDTYLVHPASKDRVIHLQTSDIEGVPIMLSALNTIRDGLTFMGKDVSGKIVPLEVPTR